MSLRIGLITLCITDCMQLMQKHDAVLSGSPSAFCFLLFTLTEPSFLSFLLMEYVLSKVNRLVFDRQLAGVQS